MSGKYLSLMGAAFAVAVAGSAMAQPDIIATPVASILVNGVEVSPTGIAADGTTLYVAGFNNRRVVKIEDPLGTPAVTQFAGTDSTTDGGPVAWPTGRGLQNVRVDGSGNVLVSGDQGANGAILLYDSAGTLLDGVYDTNQIGGANRRTTAADFYGVGYVFAETVSLAVGTVGSDLETLGTTTATGTTYNRSAVAVGDDVYVSIADNSGNESIAKLSGGTAGALNDKTVTDAWYDHGFTIASAVRWNISHLSHDGSEYLIATDASNERVEFVDLATGTSALTLTNDSHGIEEVGGAAVFTDGTDKYLALTMVDAGVTNGRVEIFQFQNSSVNEWSLY